jgi:hypothetical protein
MMNILQKWFPDRLIGRMVQASLLKLGNPSVLVIRSAAYCEALEWYATYASGVVFHRLLSDPHTSSFHYQTN